MNNQWTDRLRRLMEAHRESPPDGLWDDIERMLDRRAGAPSSRRRILLWSVCSGAAAAVAAFLLLIGGDGTADAPMNAPAESHSPALSRHYSETAPDGDPDTSPVAIPNGVGEDGVYDRIAEAAGLPETNHEEALEGEEPILSSDPETTPEAITAETASGTESAATVTPDRTPPQRPAVFVSYPGIDGSRSAKQKWQAAIYAANISSGNASGTMQNGSSGYLFSANTIGDNPARTEVTHRLPLSVGISVSYSLNDKWSIASGVTYIMLSSRFMEMGNADNLRSCEQVLHNVGIPVSVNYSVWRGRRLSFYLSGGGQVEKSVAGQVTYEPPLNHGDGSRRKMAVSDRVQWSVNGSVGAQYDLAERTGLYVEPGINYHFDNKSGIETIYKEKPLNFGLRLGLRFSL